MLVAACAFSIHLAYTMGVRTLAVIFSLGNSVIKNCIYLTQGIEQGRKTCLTRVGATGLVV